MAPVLCNAGCLAGNVDSAFGQGDDDWEVFESCGAAYIRVVQQDGHCGILFQVGDMKRTVAATVGIVAIGLVLGLGFNAARRKNRIEIGRNYFKVADVPGVRAPVTPGDPSGAVGGSTPGDKSPSPDIDDGPSLPEHPFTVISAEEAFVLSDAPGRYTGEIVFVDARDDKHFEEGHIPGAHQIDHFNLEVYMDAAMLDRLDVAETIVVYCGGGDCEDSIFLSSALLDFDIPQAKIRLFEGGMAEWTEQAYPIEEGRP